MDCAEIEARGVAEAYLLGQLTPDEREAYERHYFECARCYSELEALGAVRAALAGTAGGTSGRPGWAFLVVAAALVAGIAGLAVWELSRVQEQHASPPAATAASRPVPQQTPRESITEELGKLARFEAPPYEQARLRGSADREAFNAGMRKYAARDYAGAIPLLARTEGEDARFYLAACYVLTGQYDAARGPLETLGRDTESAYAEEALFLLGNAELKAGNGKAALDALDRVIALRGDRERDARTLRAQVARLLAR